MGQQVLPVVAKGLSEILNTRSLGIPSKGVLSCLNLEYCSASWRLGVGGAAEKPYTEY